MITDNPFVRREPHNPHALTAYRVLAVLSWVLVLVFGILYSARKPGDVSNGWPLWSQFERHFTGFSINLVIVAVYW